MSDHHGLPHDLPEYVPNWPVPVKVKVRVYRDTTFLGDFCWRWEHACPYRGGVVNYGYPQLTQPAAFEAALKHARGCW